MEMLSNSTISSQIGVVVLLAVVYCATSLTAVLGNSTVIFIVLTSRRMQSVTNFFIANLALADVIIGLLVIPFQFQAAFLQIWTLPDFLCSFCPFFQVKEGILHLAFTNLWVMKNVDGTSIS